MIGVVLVRYYRRSASSAKKIGIITSTEDSDAVMIRDQERGERSSPRPSVITGHEIVFQHDRPEFPETSPGPNPVKMDRSLLPSPPSAEKSQSPFQYETAPMDSSPLQYPLSAKQGEPSPLQYEKAPTPRALKVTFEHGVRGDDGGGGDGNEGGSGSGGPGDVPEQARTTTDNVILMHNMESMQQEERRHQLMQEMHGIHEEQVATTQPARLGRDFFRGTEPLPPARTGTPSHASADFSSISQSLV